MPGEADTIYQETSSSPSNQGAVPGSRGTGEPVGKSKKTLLTMDENACAKAIRKFWTDQESIMRRQRSQWQVNRLRRMGITGVQLVKQQDTHQWVVWAPPGGTFTIPTLNKADRLCRRLTATIFSDPAIPDAAPARDDDRASDAAEFATRCLIVEGGEGGYDDDMTARQAFDLGCTYDSGFRWWFIDPSGGGKQPKQMLASKAATTVDDALKLPNGVPQPTPYVVRYVAEDGTLVDDPDDATTEWVPRLKSRVLSGKNVRMIPGTARDIWAADGVLIGDLVPLGTLKEQFPDEIAALSEQDLKKLITERPEMYQDLLPVGIRPGDRIVSGPDPKDDSLVFVLTIYFKARPTYEQGFYGVMAGNEILLHRGPWYDAQHEKMLDLPVDQTKVWDDEDATYGKGPMRLLGPGNEVRASNIGALLEHLDRFNNRKVFWPIASALQAKAMQAATGTYIPINPGGQPIFEDIPTFPDSSLKMLDFMTGEMDDEIGLQQTAQGMAQPSVKSGIHAQRIIEQALLGLSDIKQNVLRARRRGWRIQLQLIRAYYNVPQQLRYKGEDGAYVVRQWTGSDIGDTTDVDIQPGSASMLTPSAKAAVAEHLATIQVVGEDGRPTSIMSAMDLRRQAMSSVGGTIGLQDDPQTMRVRRQISDWMQGPPETEGAPPPAPVVPGQPAAAAQPDPQMAQILADIWKPIASDDEPAVAKLRHYELVRAMASTKYSRWPEQWQQGLVAEYTRARQAAGIQTVAEQQQAAQAQTQAAQQAAQNPPVKKSIQLKGDLTQAETDAQVGAPQSPEASAAQTLAGAQAQAATQPPPMPGA